jgi:hypothetical protein
MPVSRHAAAGDACDSGRHARWRHAWLRQAGGWRLSAPSTPTLQDQAGPGGLDFKPTSPQAGQMAAPHCYATNPPHLPTRDTHRAKRAQTPAHTPTNTHARTRTSLMLLILSSVPSSR